MTTSLPSSIGEMGYMPEEATIEEKRSSMAAHINPPMGQRPPQLNLDNASHGTTNNMSMPHKSVPSGSRILSKKFGGITVRSIVQLSVVLIILTETIVGWVFAAKSAANAGSTVFTVLIHVLCGATVIITLIILKKCLSRIRADLHTHRHPGEVPSHTTTPTGLDGVSDALDIEMMIDAAIMS